MKNICIVTSLLYLIKITRTSNPVILSTGMSTLEEVRDAVEILKHNGSGEITVLHCNTEYPMPYYRMLTLSHACHAR
jgi:N,N'-diacetyllegionaminate synthase